MAKANYIPFYYRDFLHGTKLFTTEEKGAYMLLLFEQWDQGFVPEDPHDLKKITGISEKKLQKILKKFQKSENGGLINERLEIERRKYSSYINKQAQKGLQSAEARKKVNRGSNSVATEVVTGSEPQMNQSKPDTIYIVSGNHNQNQEHTDVCSADAPAKLPEQGSALPPATGQPALSPNRPYHAPGWQQVQECFYQLGQPTMALEFFEYWEGLHWMKGITPIQNWRSFANRWVANPIGQKQAATTAENPSGRIAVMRFFMGGEEEWTENKFNEYKKGTDTAYKFLKWL